MSKNRIPLIHALRFMTAGKARVVFLNMKTQGQMKFSIKASEKFGETKLFVRHWPSGQFIGTIIPLPDHNYEFKWPKDHAEKNLPFTPEQTGFYWVWKRVLDLTLPDTMHILHEGFCSYCGRPLTDGISLEIGIGPVCRGRLKINL